MRTLLLTLTTCLFVLPAQARYAGGSGTAQDPYQIATAADLIALGETPADYDKHLVMTADIDLDPNLPGRKVFDKAVIAPDHDPRDGVTSGPPFTGVFNGDGHTISRLTIRGRDSLGLLFSPAFSGGLFVFRFAFCLFTFALFRVRFPLAVGVDLLSSFGRPFLEEVEIGELAEELDGLAVVGAGRLDLIVVNAEPDGLALEDNFREPPVGLQVAVDAFEPGSGTDAFGLVALVLPRRADPQVAPAVILGTAVDVVHDRPLRRVHDLAVHQDRFSVLVSAGIPAGARRVPLVPAEPFVVGGVHEDVPAVGQGDAADRLLRLGRGGGLGTVVAADAAGGDLP